VVDIKPYCLFCAHGLLFYKYYIPLFYLPECNQVMDKKLFHLRSLIEGAIYNALGSPEMAVQCFEETVARQNGMKDDKHVAAFACYELGTICLEKSEVWNSSVIF